MNTWYEKAVFYHMYPLGMTGAPLENPPGPVTDRFSELNRWIPHMKELGCTAVYIGPLFESSTHGYDTRDYRLVDRRLGDNDSFARFVTLCHEAGIRVVVDGVFNHTGREFFAFQDILANRQNSRYCGWYKGVNFGWQSPMGDPFGYEAWHGLYILPALNLANPEVRQYLFDVIRFWTETFDIDGIRLDCANVLDFQFMKELRQMSAGLKPDFWLMGEVIHGDYPRWVNDEMLHSVTNYELHKSLYSGLNDHNFFEIAHNVRRLEAVGRSLYTFVDNHDENRIASKLKKKEHLPLAWLLLFTLPGIPSIYYGSEWGIEGMRTPYSDYDLRPRITMADGTAMHCELTDYITRLAKIHTKEPEYAAGRYQELLLTNRQYAFARHAQGSITITAANADDAPAALNIPVPISAKRAVDLMDGSIIPIENGRLNLTLEGNTGVVLKIKEE